MTLSLEKIQEWTEKKRNSLALAQQFVAILDTSSPNISLEMVEDYPGFNTWLSQINAFLHFLHGVQASGVWEE